MRPWVSVLMPVYNAQRYVAEAVESILAQTFRDFEFLIVDDGSTDRSRAILVRYAARDGRIRLISRPNTGLVVALNEMIGLARGELLARMDADDVCLPERFALQVAYLRERPDVVCLGSQLALIDYANRFVGDCKTPRSDAEIQDLALRGHTPICHPSVMMRREAVVALGGYRQALWPAEDLDLYLRLGETGKLANIEATLLRYRLHAASVSEQHQHRQLAMMKAASDEACRRRGLPPRCEPLTTWRPTNRRSRATQAVRFGWAGFMKGNRAMAIEYGLQALRHRPWDVEAWRLVACTLVKNPRRLVEPSGG